MASPQKRLRTGNSCVALQEEAIVWDKEVTALGVLRPAIDSGAVPEGASISPDKGEAYWVAGEFRYRVWIWKDGADELNWVLYVGDVKLGAHLAEYGDFRSPSVAHRRPLLGQLSRIPR